MEEANYVCTFRGALDNLLSNLFIYKQHYNTHSFHIGAATSAEKANIPDMYIDAGLMENNAHQNSHMRIDHVIKAPYK